MASGIEDELTRRIEKSGQVIAGPLSEHLRRCLAEIEAAMRLPAIPSQAGAWLARIAGNFRDALEAQLRREANDRVNRG
jgi:hypothetical protein